MICFVYSSVGTGNDLSGLFLILKILCHSYLCEKPFLLTTYHRNNLSFTIILTVASFLRLMTRYRYRLNKPVVFTYSFSQKNALIKYYGQIATLKRMRS
ncbi:hypothetical protein T12_13066 [Trichinella patagoniensis]|uniref:Uncharacterized protein n=1 Tax=Trichinella patagoniensis TaxID=990121 RepID=A0A0V0Z567_9BILA|nr:hypothetical protein T12_13066 [Trichinella patagoniensis]